MKHIEFLKKYHQTPKEDRKNILHQYTSSLNEQEFSDFWENYDVGLVNLELILAQEKNK